MIRRFRVDVDSGLFRPTKASQEIPAVAWVATPLVDLPSYARLEGTIRSEGFTSSASLTDVVDPRWWPGFPLSELHPALADLPENAPEVRRTQLEDLRAACSGVAYAVEELHAEGIELRMDGLEVTGFLLHRSRLGLRLRGIDVGELLRGRLEHEVEDLREFSITRLRGGNGAHYRLQELYRNERLRARAPHLSRFTRE